MIEEIKKLREKTGAGVIDAKRALEEAAQNTQNTQKNQKSENRKIRIIRKFLKWQ